MRYFLLFFLTIITLLSQAQVWSKINLGTSENLNRVYFTNNDLGFIIGDNGTLMKTADGGSTWDSITTGVSHNLQTISFSDTNVGYINGLKTIDGGHTWSIQTATNDYGLIHALDTSNLIAGLAGNFSGDIYKSSDGGNSWSLLANPISPQAGAYDDVCFVNDSVGYLSAWYSGHLVKTIDGGINWTEVHIDTVHGSSFLSDDYRSVDFPTLNIGLVTHQSGVLKTTDAGNTWSEIKGSNFDNSFYPRSIIANTIDNYILVGVSVGIPGIEKIYETVNGGQTWSLSKDINDGLHDVYCTESICLAVGLDGAVYKRENKSLNVNELSGNSSLSIYPNPTTEYLFINSNNLDIDNLDAIDMAGRRFELVLSEENRIDVSTLPIGLYVLRINSPGDIQSIKFMKN